MCVRSVYVCECGLVCVISICTVFMYVLFMFKVNLFRSYVSILIFVRDNILALFFSYHETDIFYATMPRKMPRQFFLYN